jgi:hypothetical protein
MEQMSCAGPGTRAWPSPWRNPCRRDCISHTTYCGPGWLEACRKSFPSSCHMKRVWMPPTSITASLSVSAACLGLRFKWVKHLGANSVFCKLQHKFTIQLQWNLRLYSYIRCIHVQSNSSVKCIYVPVCLYVYNEVTVRDIPPRNYGPFLVHYINRYYFKPNSATWSIKLCECVEIMLNPLKIEFLHNFI